MKRLILLCSIFIALNIQAQVSSSNLTQIGAISSFENGSYSGTIIIGDPVVSIGYDTILYTGGFGYMHILSMQNSGPSANIEMPQGDFPELSVVHLDGTNSFDPDGDQLTYLWSSLDGIELQNANSATASFLAPDVLVQNFYRFTLEVDDGMQLSEPDTMYIGIRDLNWFPVIKPSSMNAISLVTENNNPVSQEDIVGAFVNDECRAFKEIIEFNDETFSNLTIQTDVSNEVIEFKFFDRSENSICDFESTIFSEPGGNPYTFNPYNPLILNTECSSSFLIGDLNGDCEVTITDLSIFLSAFGCFQNCENGDFDGNGSVTSSDLSVFLSAFGMSCE